MEVFPSLEDLRRWADRLEEVQERLAPSFERSEHVTERWLIFVAC